MISRTSRRSMRPRETPNRCSRAKLSLRWAIPSRYTLRTSKAVISRTRTPRASRFSRKLSPSSPVSGPTRNGAKRYAEGRSLALCASDISNDSWPVCPLASSAASLISTKGRPSSSPRQGVSSLSGFSKHPAASGSTPTTRPPSEEDTSSQGITHRPWRLSSTKSATVTVSPSLRSTCWRSATADSLWSRLARA